MDLNQLKYFQTVARTRSFTGAAKALHVGQSTLSEAVKRLEEDLGTALFLRGRSGVLLTDAGTLLLERAEAVLSLVDRTTHEVRDLRAEPRGTLILGCHDSLGSYFLPGFLSSFLPANEGIEVEVRNHGSAEVRDQVIAGDLHLGLVVNPRPHPDLVMVDAFEDWVMPVARSRAPTLEAANQTLRSSRVVVPTRAPFGQLLDALHGRGVSPKQILSCGDLGVARSLAVAGIGPALLPWRVATDGTSLVPLHPDLPQLQDQVVLIWRADLPRTRATSGVREALLAHSRALPRPHYSHNTVSNAPNEVSSVAASSSSERRNVTRSARSAPAGVKLAENAR